MTDKPDAAALLEEARRTFVKILLPLLPAEHRYDGLMVANAMDIAAREAEQAGGSLREGVQRLGAVFDESNATPAPSAEFAARLLALERRLASEIRAGLHDTAGPHRDAIRDYLRWSTVARLRVSNPRALP